MITLDEIANASLEQLNLSLAQYGRHFQADIGEARNSVARILHQIDGFHLFGSGNNDEIRLASVEEVVESANAGPEGHILVDGRKCYVA